MQAEGFIEFYRAVHDHEPFPWQRRLVARILAGDWPALLELPTASGKTSVIDIAVFALAAQADLPLTERQAPLRCSWWMRRICPLPSWRPCKRWRGFAGGRRWRRRGRSW